MGSIEKGRVILGGLVAGVVLNVGEYVLNGVLLKERWDAAMVDLELEPMGPATIGVMVLLTFVVGLILVWTYAAIRERFSPGPKTATIAALQVWVLLYVFPFVWNSLTPVFPTDLLLIATVWGLFELPIAAVVGAFLYKEGPGA